MATTPTLQHVTWMRGDSFAATLTIDTGDLTGADIRFTVKTDRDLPDSAAVLSASVGSGITIQSAYTAAIVIPASAMAALATRTYRYDIQIEKPDGTVKTLVEGIFAIKADVTRAT